MSLNLHRKILSTLKFIFLSKEQKFAFWLRKYGEKGDAGLVLGIGKSMSSRATGYRDQSIFLRRYGSSIIRHAEIFLPLPFETSRNTAE